MTIGVTREIIVGLFQKFVADLPASCASIESKDELIQNVVDLVPRNVAAARLRVIIPAFDEQELTLIAGRGTVFEIPNSGHRYTALPLIEETRAICVAVISGDFEEIIVCDGEDVIRSMGKIKLSGSNLTVRWRSIVTSPFLKKEKKYYNYEPYCSNPTKY